jgi:hydroxylamine reductase (hybrid-cluster protein)
VSRRREACSVISVNKLLRVRVARDFGVCGKPPEVAALQDLLVYALKGLSLYAVEGRKAGIDDAETNRFPVKHFSPHSRTSTLTLSDFKL